MNPWFVLAIVIFTFIVILGAIYLLLMKPSAKRGGVDKYKQVKFAHRGLHNEKIPENSLGAFALAVEHGFGIELDVHAAKDGVAIVFHDATLTRMIGADARLCNLTSEELCEMKLLGSEEKIPTLREVLELVGGKVPLLIELKQDVGENNVAKAAAELLREYSGDFIVESFNPVALAEFAKEMPEVRRGILAQKFTENPNHRSLKYRASQNFLLNRICKPDFVAFKHTHAGFLPFKIMKKIYNPMTVAWTVRSEEEEKKAYQNGFDSVIFENYIPVK